VNPHIKGCIATGGNDKLVKVWNVLDSDAGGKSNVSLVTSRDLGVVSDIFLALTFINSGTGQGLFGRVLAR
jgi:hypothetical protein